MSEQNLLQQIKEVFQSGFTAMENKLVALESKLIGELATKEEVNKKIDEVRDSLVDAVETLKESSSQDLIDAVETLTDVLATKEELGNLENRLTAKLATKEELVNTKQEILDKTGKNLADTKQEILDKTGKDLADTKQEILDKTSKDLADTKQEILDKTGRAIIRLDAKIDYVQSNMTRLFQEQTDKILNHIDPVMNELKTVREEEGFNMIAHDRLEENYQKVKSQVTGHEIRIGVLEMQTKS